MAEHTLATDDPAGLQPANVRWRALAAAEAVLEHYGATVEECAEVARGHSRNSLLAGRPSTTFLTPWARPPPRSWRQALWCRTSGSGARLSIVGMQAALPH